jgi:hypothetical protein
MLSLCSISCASPAPTPARTAAATPSSPASSSVPPPAPPAPKAEEGDAAYRAMLARVASARGLPIKTYVPLHVIDRDLALEKIRKHADGDMPKDVIAAEGESLVAIGLVPTTYDFVEGAYELVGGRIAGFYSPEDRAMYVVSDLDDDEAEQTFAHELVHALQDQSFTIADSIKYVPGDGDRIAAAHTLLEGDATSAMLDVTMGSAFKMEEATLSRLLRLSTAMSVVGAKTPKVLRDSLTAPYEDGFSFVQALRKKGGFAAVDKAFLRLPRSTEQVLHVEKYEADEPPLKIAVPTLASLPTGFRAILDDVMGEQGIRIIFNTWASATLSREASAGWGGDRYVVARRDEVDGTSFAMGWKLRFDTTTDAAEAVALITKKLGGACSEHDVGPAAVALAAKGRDVVLAAGPYTKRKNGTTKAIGTCATATAWAREMLKADAEVAR